jgi:hypothetical protein
VLQWQEKPTRSDQCDRLGEKGTTPLEKPRERLARAVKKKNREKKQRVPREQGKPQRRAGRTWPMKDSRRADENRGLRKAPEASGRSTARTSRKAGKLSKR